LKVGDSAKMAGVEVGRVERIVLENEKVRVMMKLHGNAVVKTDSKATIKFTGLMGQNFVSLISARRARHALLTGPFSQPKHNPTSMPSWPNSTKLQPALKTSPKVSAATQSIICLAR